MAKRTLRIALTLIVAMVFVWLVLRQVESSELQRALGDAKIAWIIVSVAAFVAAYVFRIERWRLMLVHANPALTWRVCAGPFMASFAVNNVLPLRAGDVLRTFAFSHALGVSSGIVIATLFVERLLDLLMVLIVMGVMLAVFEIDAAHVAGISAVLLVSVAALILFLLLFPGSFTQFVTPLADRISRASPVLGKKLSAEVNKCLAMLRELARGYTMVKLIGWSLLAWITEGCVFWLAAAALPAIAVPLAGWLALPVTAFATLIPSAPGYVGTFDYFAVRAMEELGNTTASATAYALVVHAVIWLTQTISGGMYLLIHPLNQPREARSGFGPELRN